MLHVKPLYLCSFTSSCMFRTVGQEIQCFLHKMETTVHLSSPRPFIWLIYKTRLTYNSTHIRSTKEGLTFEYLDPPLRGEGVTVFQRMIWPIFSPLETISQVGFPNWHVSGRGGLGNQNRFPSHNYSSWSRSAKGNFYTSSSLKSKLLASYKRKNP